MKPTVRAACMAVALAVFALPTAASAQQDLNAFVCSRIETLEWPYELHILSGESVNQLDTNFADAHGNLILDRAADGNACPGLTVSRFNESYGKRVRYSIETSAERVTSRGFPRGIRHRDARELEIQCRELLTSHPFFICGYGSFTLKQSAPILNPAPNEEPGKPMPSVVLRANEFEMSTRILDFLAAASARFR